MKGHLLILYIICCISTGYATPPIELSEVNHLLEEHQNELTYLITDKDQTFQDIQHQAFNPSSFYPEISKRRLNKSIWMKFSAVSLKGGIYVFDFFRKDYVDLFITDQDSLINHFRTGYVLPSSEKNMGKWNTIRVDMEAGQERTYFVKIVNDVNETDLVLNVEELAAWRNSMLSKLIGDIAFLAVLLIIAAHSFLVYIQSKIKAYFNFGIYLFLVFIFYSFITKIMRDYMMPELPELTLYSVSVALIIPYFYYGFVKEFLNMPKVVPKLNRVFQWIVRFDFIVLVIDVLYFLITKDYYIYSDVIRVALFINVFSCTGIVFVIWRNGDPLVKYFVLGTISMLFGVIVDLIIWRSNASNLGDFARVGFVMEILFFSIGLGKKTQLVAQAKRTVQRSYIEQLEINKGLIERQKSELARMVEERTSELQIAKERAEEHAKAREDFLSVMSHEIRTPMNAIVGLTHLLSDDSSEKEKEKNLDTLRYSVDNLMRLINDILDYRKIDSGNIELEYRSFELSKIVVGITHLFASEANNKDVDFELIYDDKIHKGFLGDPYRLSQVLGNLLSNAIKFTNIGKVTLKISLCEETHDFETIMFEIIDTGIGISQADQQRIFEHFNQASLETTRKYGGTGLGLSISKSLVSLMNGDISVKSHEGKGSTFSFSLKFKKANVITEEDNFDRTYDIPEGSIEGLKCLIVDDNKLNRVVLTKFLKNWKVLSDNVESGFEALKYLDNQKYDLLLLDLQMPEMDGYEVARRVRSNSDTKDLPIIAITADSVSNIKEKVKAVGMNDFVTKPFNPDMLKSKIYQATMIQNEALG